MAALADFDALWASLAPREQARVVELLVDQVAYDGQHGSVQIAFRLSGIRTLAAELGNGEGFGGMSSSACRPQMLRRNLRSRENAAIGT